MEQEKLNELLKSYYFYKENKEAVELAAENDLTNDYMRSLSFEENIKREEKSWQAHLQKEILDKDLFFLCLYILQRIIEGIENCKVDENSFFQKIEIESFIDGDFIDDRKIKPYSAWFLLKYQEEEARFEFDIANLRLIVDREYVEGINNNNLWEPIYKDKRKNYSEMATASIDKIWLNKDITIDELVNRLKDPAKQFLENFIAICDAKSKENEESENDEDSED